MSSTTMAASAKLHRAMFIEVAGEIIWDKEWVDVWDDFVAKVERKTLTTADRSNEADDR